MEEPRYEKGYFFVAKDESFIIGKMLSIGIQVKYQNAEKFKETIAKYKANMEALLKELGCSR
jgi:hypothetical protein